MTDGNISVSGTHIQNLQFNYNKETGNISDLKMLDATSLGVRGNLSESELNTLKTRLRDTIGADTTGTKEKIADKADTTETKKAELPKAYTSSGRYTEAKTDADLREGFKGDKVTAEQQRLKDLGYDVGDGGTNHDGVDGFWGPKTQKAYDQYLADTKRTPESTTPDTKTTTTPDGKTKPTDPKTTTSTQQQDIDALRADAKTRTKYQKVDNPDETTKELVQDIKAGNTDDIIGTLTNTRNADMKEIDKRLPRDQNGNYTTPLADVDGNDSDFADLGNKMLKGNRNEGADAAANSKAVDGYAKQLLEAREQPGIGHYLPSFMDGTDEAKMNDVFATASGAQLKELDRRFREGIKTDSGEVVKFPGGLEEYVKSEIGEGAHRDMLLAQLNRPLR